MKESVCKYPAIDAHLDLGLYLRRERQKGRRQVLLEDYLSDMRAGNVKAVVSAIFVDEQSEWGSALQQACDQVVALQTEVPMSSSSSSSPRCSTAWITPP